MVVEQRGRLDAVQSLSERQRRLIWLQGLGFSYREMADHEQASLRTVERQVLRARGRLREAGRERLARRGRGRGRGSDPRPARRP